MYFWPHAFIDFPSPDLVVDAAVALGAESSVDGGGGGAVLHISADFWSIFGLTDRLDSSRHAALEKCW